MVQKLEKKNARLKAQADKLQNQVISMRLFLLFTTFSHNEKSLSQLTIFQHQ